MSHWHQSNWHVSSRCPTILGAYEVCSLLTNAETFSQVLDVHGFYSHVNWQQNLVQFARRLWGSWHIVLGKFQNYPTSRFQISFYLVLLWCSQICLFHNNIEKLAVFTIHSKQILYLIWYNLNLYQYSEFKSHNSDGYMLEL